MVPFMLNLSGTTETTSTIIQIGHISPSLPRRTVLRHRNAAPESSEKVIDRTTRLRTKPNTAAPPLFLVGVYLFSQVRDIVFREDPIAVECGDKSLRVVLVDGLYKILRRAALVLVLVGKDYGAVSASVLLKIDEALQLESRNECQNRRQRKMSDLTRIRREQSARVDILDALLVHVPDELHDLKVNRRKEVAGKIKEAREQGDLSENAEYDAAKDEQRDIEARIEEIEKILKNAEVVVEDEVDLDKISVGCSVKIYDEEYEEEMEYKIVGSSEANSLKGKISNESPVGHALLGHKVGDEVTVETQAGEIHYKVLSIHRSN